MKKQGDIPVGAPKKHTHLANIAKHLSLRYHQWGAGIVIGGYVLYAGFWLYPVISTSMSSTNSFVETAMALVMLVIMMTVIAMVCFRGARYIARRLVTLSLVGFVGGFVVNTFFLGIGLLRTDESQLFDLIISALRLGGEYTIISVVLYVVAMCTMIAIHVVIEERVLPSRGLPYDEPVTSQ